MGTEEFYLALCKSIKKRKDIIIKRYKLSYRNGGCDFIKILSKGIKPKDKVILIRAGIHGDETAGPLTILNYVNQIIDLIHQNNLKVILYPLGNPSGFEAGLRYNIDGDKGSEDAGNNDFLRYELENGKIARDIGKGDEFKRWHWASDERLGIRLPEETSLMHKLLKEDPLPQIVAFLDLHQDCLTPNAPAAAYHYSFGDLRVYRNIIRKIKGILPIVDDRVLFVDKWGFFTQHDGSLDDLMHRLGVKYCVTIETTGATPLDIACKVNLIWIFGIIDLVSPQKG